MARLSDQIAIVTGASSGIGAAVAKLFGREGAAVVLAHHEHPADAAKIVAEIEAAGSRALAIGGDVRDDGYADRVFAAAEETFGRPTVLVNSAGVDAAGIPIGEMTVDQFRKVLETNLVGPFLFAVPSCAPRSEPADAERSSTLHRCTKTSRAPALPTIVPPRADSGT